MPNYKTIINAALNLSGMEEILGGTRQRWDPPADHAARSIFETIIIGARLGKVAATPNREWHINESLTLEWSEEAICGWSLVDLDEVRAFVGSPARTDEGRRDKQLRLMVEKAKVLGIDLKSPKRGQKSALKKALVGDDSGLFSNFDDVWKAGLKKGIVVKIET